VAPIEPALVRDVDLLCLDAGNCVIFFDHARLARLGTAAGFTLDAATLVRTEGEAKLAHERGEMQGVAWSARHLPGARGWGDMMATMLHLAGVPLEALPRFLTTLWEEHVAMNTYSVVPVGFAPAMERVRAAGVKVAIVSNSEGMLEKLFADLGILRHFDLVVDSGVVGVTKPDPRIFQIALDHFAIDADRALMLGDTFATDIAGARAAGMRAALVDPFGHMEGRHRDVMRVPGVVEVAEAIAGARG
jgi:HAD superfamily hydrolase (TIGR01549 family)